MQASTQALNGTQQCGEARTHRYHGIVYVVSIYYRVRLGCPVGVEGFAGACFRVRLLSQLSASQNSFQLSLFALAFISTGLI